MTQICKCDMERQTNISYIALLAEYFTGLLFAMLGTNLCVYMILSTNLSLTLVDLGTMVLDLLCDLVFEKQFSLFRHIMDSCCFLRKSWNLDIFE